MLGRPAVTMPVPSVRCRPSQTFAPQIAYTSASIDGSEVSDDEEASQIAKDDTTVDQGWATYSKDFTLRW